MRWTPEQDECLRRYAALGVEDCRRMIARHTGAARSVDAVKMRASRLGVPLAKARSCSECGQAMPKGMRGDLCEACRYRRRTEEQHRYGEYLRSEKARYERFRQRYRREAKRNGLPSFSEWQKKNSGSDQGSNQKSNNDTKNPHGK